MSDKPTCSTSSKSCPVCDGKGVPKNPLNKNPLNLDFEVWWHDVTFKRGARGGYKAVCKHCNGTGKFEDYARSRFGVTHP